jgi:mevalonate kinase
LNIEVKSKLPVISGFGASAYVASTVIGSLKIMSGKNLTLEELNKLTYEVEKIIHGRPSGADPTTVVYGGVIKFSKTNDKFEFRKINFDKKIKKKKMWLINSGKASESTGEMVELVRKKMERQRIKFSKIITKMGEITDLIIRSFENGVIETELIEENERRLEELGVVGERAKAMIKKIEAVEGAAKISGAGGVKSGSGLILVYHKDPNLMEEIIKQEAWQSFDGKTGGAGWRRE